MIEFIQQWLGRLFGAQERLKDIVWEQHWTDFLTQKVTFYRVLSAADKTLFNQRILLFLQTTTVEAGQFEATEEDALLVAASAIIPVWGFPKWHYFNLKTVFLLPASFNAQFECGKPDSTISGMVGNGPMTGKMALSRPHLYAGFDNSRDKKNVGIHEFAHLVDMADGDCDGFPEHLKEFSFAIPWFDLVAKKTAEICKTQQPPAKAGGLALRTESPDTGHRPVYSSVRKLSSTLGSK